MRLLVVLMTILVLQACTSSPIPRYGMYGGGSAQNDGRPQDPPFDTNAIDFGTRWFPTYLRFAPGRGGLASGVSVAQFVSDVYNRMNAAGLTLLDGTRPPPVNGVVFQTNIYSDTPVARSCGRAAKSLRGGGSMCGRPQLWSAKCKNRTCHISNSRSSSQSTTHDLPRTAFTKGFRGMA